jgi:hypothetical protein
MLDFFGITRERVYSPGKVDADRAILDAVAAALAGAHRVDVHDGDRPLPADAPAPVVFAMCQSPSALATLQRWESAGVRVINSSAGIANTHRRRMIDRFAAADIAHPASTLLSTDAPGDLPEWIDSPTWLKRGDVHATDPDDVVRVSGRAAAAAALAAMRRRGIANALAQRHVDGDVFKFYAVRQRFFVAYPPAADAAPLTAGVEAAMRGLAEDGAAALELEVFGGDCVRDSQQRLWLIDLNDWPSYGRCRFAAGEAIAAYLQAVEVVGDPAARQ